MFDYVFGGMFYFNGDGLTILDATAIQRYLARLSSLTGIGEPIS